RQGGQRTCAMLFIELGRAAAHPEVTSRVLGRSTEGRPIYVAKTPTTAEALVLLGRAHPPEVTGTIAMREFVDAVLADTELAKEFRQRFSLIILPVLNPDGSARGYWRHNVNGKDLNRDWGIFSQIETQNVARLLEGLDRANVQVQMMLDFHSTQRNLFYTQIPEESYQEMDFASAWLDAAADRLPDFEFTQEANPTSEQANSKNYFHERYKIASITYELGDETDRDEIIRVTPVFADEFMKTMLRMPKPE
ncbi:MAG: M14 family metallopeptidase, partial [Pseudomonadota bacterium]